MYLKLSSTVLTIFAHLLYLVFGAPVKSNTLSPEDAKEIEESDLEYSRYLKEVVEQLESDQTFKALIMNASQEDIRSGKISELFDVVHPDVRSKLDEAKRLEVDRLKKINNPLREHLNTESEHEFNKEDLRRLVLKATQDLEEIDRRRKEKFKEHEIREKFNEEQRRLKMTPEELAKAKAEEEKRRKQDSHPELNHPMSKDQQEEVWEKVDHMPKESFDPKTYYHLHDMDGNGQLDEYEIKAMLQKELDKVYESPDAESAENKANSAGLNGDFAQREEEMERMREHVFKEMDVDRNGLISYDEFMANVNTQEYKNDPGWKTIDEQPPVFSEQEYAEYEKQHLAAGQPAPPQAQQQPPAAIPPAAPAVPILDANRV